MKYKILIVAFLIVSWCGLIYYASSRTSEESNSTSKNLLYKGINITLKTTNKIGLTNIEPTSENFKLIVEKLNYPLRKLAHLTIYFVLAILTFILFRLLKVKNTSSFIATLIFCFFYALTDEYHQTFVANRTGQFKDCLIDLTGALIGTFIILIIIKYREKIILRRIKGRMNYVR